MKAAAEAGDRASRADSRTPPSLVLGASLLLPFVRTGGFGGDALVLGAVGAWRGWQFVLWTAWWAALAGAFSVRDSGPLLALFTQALRSRIPRRWKWQSPPSQLAYPPALPIGRRLSVGTAGTILKSCPRTGGGSDGNGLPEPLYVARRLHHRP
jgi:hypothetical protein